MPGHYPQPDAQSSVDHQQQRGAGWDVVDEAIETYDQWMLDDDYGGYTVLRKIVARMRERRDLYRDGPGA